MVSARSRPCHLLPGSPVAPAGGVEPRCCLRPSAGAREGWRRVPNTYASALWYSPAFSRALLPALLSCNRSVLTWENQTFFCNLLKGSRVVSFPPPLAPAQHPRPSRRVGLGVRSVPIVPAYPRAQRRDGRAMLVCGTAHRNTGIYPPRPSPGPYAVPADAVSLVR